MTYSCPLSRYFYAGGILNCTPKEGYLSPGTRSGSAPAFKDQPNQLGWTEYLCPHAVAAAWHLGKIVIGELFLSPLTFPRLS